MAHIALALLMWGVIVGAARATWREWREED